MSYETPPSGAAPTSGLVPPPASPVRHSYPLLVRDYSFATAVSLVWRSLTVVIAILLTAAFRPAFIKPIFLVKMMIRFHTLVENQPINEAWDARLSEISDKFRNLAQRPTATARSNA